MALTPGSRLGPYEITTQIGVGGMGEVYKATDTNLKRAVAIKVLPVSVAADADRLARFQREAEILATLNHPNIAAIYGLERSGAATALVMELVEGSTLAERIAQGAISVDEALLIARQIAEALEAAHEQGIIHRDLKPANIKVRPDGTVKVLDFGLAKTLAPAFDDAPTLTAIRTQAGAIMGTASYMSPEQVRGEAAGRQADIWSFGVVLYELLTGVSPFRRPTTAETLAGVLGTQPDYSVLPSNTPANARHLLRRCLERDRKRRWQHVGDVRIEIEEALAALTEAPPGPVGALATTGRRRRTAGAIMLAVLAGVAGWLLAQRSASTTPAAVVRLSIPSLEPPSSWPFGLRHLAVSEDGSRVAYASANRLWIRRMGQKEGVAIQVSALNPFFSPDGEWVAFFGGTGGDHLGLKKVPVVGGTPVPIVTTSDRPGGGTWRADGTIVFATTSGLYQVSENGGEPQRLVTPDPGRKERLYAWPQFMPDGRSVLFTIVPEGAIEGAQIAALDLKTLEASIVLKGGSAARYATTGHLVYTSGKSLKAIAFDPDSQRTRGEPVVLPDIEISTAPDNGAADFAVSRTGTLLFITPHLPGRLRTLSWVDRHGKKESLALAPNQYQYARISPDGTRVALDITNANRDIWIWSLRRPGLTKLTGGPTEDVLPVWSRDGRRVFFSSNRTGNFDVYSQAADGATEARVEFAGPGSQMTTSLTPDGTRLLVVDDFKDLNMLNLARPDRVEPLLHGQFNELAWGWCRRTGTGLPTNRTNRGTRWKFFCVPFPT